MMKLVGYPGMEESFMSWGLDKRMMVVVAIIEIILAIMVFAKQTRNLAFAGLIILMTAALYIHITNYEYEEIGPATWILTASVLLLLYDLLKLDDYIEKAMNRYNN